MLMVEPTPAEDLATADAVREQQPPVAGSPVPDDVHHMIAEAAYYLAERRGFEPGHEIDDWLEAQAQVYDVIATP